MKRGPNLQNLHMKLGWLAECRGYERGVEDACHEAPAVVASFDQRTNRRQEPGETSSKRVVGWPVCTVGSNMSGFYRNAATPPPRVPGRPPPFGAWALTSYALGLPVMISKHPTNPEIVGSVTGNTRLRKLDNKKANTN